MKPLTTITPLRGRVVVSLPKSDTRISPAGIIYQQKGKDKDEHWGRVLAMGPPALSAKGHPIAPGFEVGDVVLYCLALALDKVRTLEIEGQKCIFVAQEEVMAVGDESCLPN